MKSATGCFSIIADECKDKGGVRQLSISARYVHQGSVVERFMAFIDLHAFDANSIKNHIVDFFKSQGLDMKMCIGQAYDGANAMSGGIGGLQKLIQDEIGAFCPYVHCFAHRLNLALV